MPFRCSRDEFQFAIQSDSEDEQEDTFQTSVQRTIISKSALVMTSTTASAATEAPVAITTDCKAQTLVRRRSSVRSRISYTALQANAQDLLIDDYSIDLRKRTVDDFEQLKILGVGSYGSVHLVKDKHTGQYFAKKTIKKARLSVNKTLLKNQMNERDILASISHPAIVKLFYAFHDLENMDLILEFIPGGELFYYLADVRRFNENDTAFYMAEISQALHHLHSIGVVYRDLKPENCLLDKKGHLVLTDFGLSSQEEKCRSILGTPEYSAPEVLMGKEYSYEADWWSFGVMMYDMVVGQVPYPGSDRKKLITSIQKRGANFPNWLSEDAKDIMRKLLQRDPKKRMDVDGSFDKFMNHRFFRKIDWKRLRDSTPPVEPQVGSPEDTKVDSSYIDYGLAALKQHSTSEYVDQSLFRGFSFVAEKSVLEQHYDQI